MTNSARLPLCWKPPGIERREKVPMLSRDGSSDRVERPVITADGPKSETPSRYLRERHPIALVFDFVAGAFTKPMATAAAAASG